MFIPPLAIPAVDPDLAAALQQRIDQKTKPPGSLGRLESLAVQLALAQHCEVPSVDAVVALVFAADHGAVAAGVSAWPQAVTAQMVHNFLSGGAAINAFTKLYGVPLFVVDAGVAAELGKHPQLTNAKIALGTANYLHEPAMSIQQLRHALRSGRLIAHRFADMGKQVLLLGEMGIGNTASAALLMHRFTGVPLAECVGCGAGLDEAGLAHKLAQLSQASARVPEDVLPINLLAEFGGFEIAMLAGAMLGAAERRVVSVVDGFIGTAAAMAALCISADLAPYLVYAHCGAEHGHRRLLEELSAEPLLDLQLRLGEGTGAALAYPLLLAACAFNRDMASFDSAGVSQLNDGELNDGELNDGVEP